MRVVDTYLLPSLVLCLFVFITFSLYTLQIIRRLMRMVDTYLLPSLNLCLIQSQ